MCLMIKLGVENVRDNHRILTTRISEINLEACLIIIEKLPLGNKSDFY